MEKTTIKLNPNERTTLSYLATVERGTLHDLAARFQRRARKAPKRWRYATKVSTKKRTAFRASLLARNSVRRLVREKALRKPTPGTYEITPIGRSLLSK